MQNAKRYVTWKICIYIKIYDTFTKVTFTKIQQIISFNLRVIIDATNFQ